MEKISLKAMDLISLKGAPICAQVFISQLSKTYKNKTTQVSQLYYTYTKSLTCSKNGSTYITS